MMITKIEREVLFDSWWDAYDKKVGKKEAKAKWSKVDQKHFEKIFEHTPEYVKSTPEKRYRMHPATYLYGEHFDDEIIYKTPQKSKMDSDTVEKLQKYG